MPTHHGLLAVSDRRRLAAGGWTLWCEALSTLGVEALQVRESDLDDRELLAMVIEARRAFPAPGRLLVNRRFDVARAAAADGVHLPASGLPVAAVRAAVGDRLLVGRSTHAVDEVRAARASGADYVVFGPVFDTPSKRGRIAPRGLDGLAEAIAVGVPVIAIGGIEPDNVGAVLACGAAGAAAMRAVATPEAAAELVAAAREARR